jgi:hypothetical protein
MNVARLSSHAERLLFMTGTALENRVDEMVSLIACLRPDIAREVSKITYLSGAPQFRDKVAPVYYRRRREEVLGELPDLIEKTEWCVLSEEEEEIYEDAVLSRNFNLSRRVSWNIPDIKNSAKAKRMLELIDEAAEDGIFTETAPYVGIGSRPVLPKSETGGRSVSPMGWTLGVPVMVDVLLRYDGDIEIVREAYPALVRFADIISARYPDDDIPAVTDEGLSAALDSAGNALERLLSDHDSGRPGGCTDPLAAGLYWRTGLLRLRISRGEAP